MAIQTPNIFNAKIAQAINKGLGKLLLNASLGKLTSSRNPTDPTKTDTSYEYFDCKGFTDDYSARERAGTTIQIGDKKVTLLGASFSSTTTIPAVGDRVSIEGETRTIKDVKRDPAGATYTCHVR